MVRKKQTPHIEIIHTYRLGPHSKGDDDREKDEIRKWYSKDPLKILEKRMDSIEIEKIEKRVMNLLTRAETEVRKMDFSSIKLIPKSETYN